MRVNNFYVATIKTIEELDKKNILSSIEIKKCWEQNLKSLGASESTIVKGCPRNALISLVLNDHVIFRNSQKKIVRVQKNSVEYTYCLMAICILKENFDGFLSGDQLWNLVEEKLQIRRSHQGEMNILLALWDKGFLKV